MKYISILIFGIIIVCSCSVHDNNAKKRNKEVPPEIKLFTLLVNVNITDTIIFISVNPSFCGACNADFISYIENFKSRFQPIIFLMSSSDEKIARVIKSVKNSTIIYPTYEEMEKHGLTGPYNTIYFVVGNGILKKFTMAPENYQMISDFAKH